MKNHAKKTKVITDNSGSIEFCILCSGMSKDKKNELINKLKKSNERGEYNG